ncbi:MAG: YaiO family outer membrane beta-barrel protein [Candidatus Aminicenantaceae bacterium]
MLTSMPSRALVLGILAGLFLAAAPGFASIPTEIPGQQVDVDELFRQALHLGREGRFDEARRICLSILEQVPRYYDVRVYLGRLYLWQHEYESGSQELQKVLIQVPDHRDALNAMVDAELWSGHTDVALEYCERGLGSHPEDQDFLWKKIRILYLKKDYHGAADALHHLLAINPEHAEALRIERLIQSSVLLLEFSQTYRMDILGREDQDLKPWHFFSLEGAYYTGRGPLIGRINSASRDYGAGRSTGTQFELDAYPIFSERFYAYLNAGLSSDDIFPRYRLGGELYANLPKAFELSGGLRYMKFEDSHVTIFTGTLGKYYKDYWFSFRPSISSESKGSNVSGLLWVRRYFRSADEFIGMLAGFGNSPMELNFLEDIQRYSSYQIGVEVRKPLSRAILFRGHLGYEREEYQPDVFGNRFVVYIRLEERVFRKY